jgi:hypothetical protein
MTDTPIYDDTLAWQRGQEQDRVFSELWSLYEPHWHTHKPILSEWVRPEPDPIYKEAFMSRRDVQFLFWSMIIAGFFGVMLALALNGWFD